MRLDIMPQDVQVNLADEHAHDDPLAVDDGGAMHELQHNPEYEAQLPPQQQWLLIVQQYMQGIGQQVRTSYSACSLSVCLST